MPARLDLSHTRILTLAASVNVRGGESGVRATEFSGSYWKNAHIPRGTRSGTIPIRAKKVTPTVATGSARAARDVDADDRGERCDGHRASRAARETPRARPARHQRATARSCLSREKNCARRARIPVCQKSHINSPTRNFAGSAATPRRDSRRAVAGVHSHRLAARVTRRARREVSSRARAGVPENGAF